MTDAEWETQAEYERKAFERFHAMRKHNSSRIARQEAWAETVRILDARRIRSRCTHPIAPKDRYWAYDGSAPKGWTFPGLRTLAPDEVDALFPGTLVAFSYQNIDPSRFVFDEYSTIGGKLRVSVPMVGIGYRHTCMTWLPEMGIWRRYQRAIRVKPYRELLPVEIALRTVRAGRYL